MFRQAVSLFVALCPGMCIFLKGSLFYHHEKRGPFYSEGFFEKEALEFITSLHTIKHLTGYFYVERAFSYNVICKNISFLTFCN